MFDFCDIPVHVTNKFQGGSAVIESACLDNSHTVGNDNFLCTLRCTFPVSAAVCIDPVGFHDHGFVETEAYAMTTAPDLNRVLGARTFGFRWMVRLLVRGVS